MHLLEEKECIYKSVSGKRKGGEGNGTYYLAWDREDALDKWLSGIFKDLSCSGRCKIIPDNSKELNHIQERIATGRVFHST